MPAMAMRTGQSRVPFFMPFSAAMPMRVSWSSSSFQSGSASSTGMTISSTSFDTALSVLLFLLVKRAAS